MNSKKEYMRLYYLRNKEKTIAYAKNRRIERPDIRKSWLKENGHKPKVRFDKAKHDAGRRNKEWNLTFEEYEKFIAKPCFYCNSDLSKEKGCGLDRINNDLGYKLDNVVQCCKACNTSRNVNFTSEEWKIMIDRVLEFRKNKGV